MINNLYDQLELFKDARRNAFITAITINSDGRHIAGTYGVNIPREILWALDIVPINIYSIDDSNIKAAEEFLDKKNCSLIKASYGYAIKDKCPFTHFADIIIGSTMCPNKLSMIKKLEHLKKVLILKENYDVDALALEYRNFASYIEKEFGTRINETKLAYAIRKTNAINKKANELLNLYLSKPRIIDCDDLYSIIYGLQFILDLDEKYDKLSAITESFEKVISESMENNDEIKCILIIGAPLAGLKEKILKPVSKMKNTLILFAPSPCEGANYKIADEDIDPFRALALKYLTPKSSQELSDLCVKYNPDAIVEVKLAGCKTLYDKYADFEKPYYCVITEYNDSEMNLNQLNDFINNL
nr:2-hydroxyacyl-CoA dehydratase family protein [Sedimentibacter sp.]